MCEGGVPEVWRLVTMHPPLPCEWGTRLSPHHLQEGPPSHIPALLGWHQLLTLWCNLTRKRSLHVLASLIPSSANCVFTLCLFIGANVSPSWLQGLLYSYDISFCRFLLFVCRWCSFLLFVCLLAGHLCGLFLASENLARFTIIVFPFQARVQACRRHR